MVIKACSATFKIKRRVVEHKLGEPGKTLLRGVITSTYKQAPVLWDLLTLRFVLYWRTFSADLGSSGI